MKLAIVGRFGGTHLGGSLARAAQALELETMCFDIDEASLGPRLLATSRWYLADRQPVRLNRFSAHVVSACAEARPNALIATGSAALTASALRALRKLGVTTVNFSTDDPWNAAMSSRWHQRALPVYDTVFTPRRANLGDFQILGCSDVRYLPFGYDEALFAPPVVPGPPPAGDVLFVGGGDRDRLAFMRHFLRSGPTVSLVGGYWERFAETRAHAAGLKSPEELRFLTAAAKVNLCVVRRANRDGHVMRTFEIAAIGGCMLTEDTMEHREIFGPDGECVRYFNNADQAAERAHALIADAPERNRLAQAVHQRIVSGGNSYRDRLRTMIASAPRPPVRAKESWDAA
jgi:spore maturation protein CgeB